MIKFEVCDWVKKDDLKDMNCNSLLFPSDIEICFLDIGNIGLSLLVKGEVRIENEKTGEIYKDYSQFDDELKNQLKKGTIDEKGQYIIYDNNWFEIYVDKIDEMGNGIELMFTEVADIEGELKGKTKKELVQSLFEFMLKWFNDYITLEDIDLMTITKERELLSDYKIKDIYYSYDELENKENTYKNNHNYNWYEVFYNRKEKCILIKTEKR